jgi:hypothetical protein
MSVVLGNAAGHSVAARRATSVMSPLPERVLAVAVYGNGIVTAAGADITVHELTPRHMRPKSRQQQLTT